MKEHGDDGGKQRETDGGDDFVGSILFYMLKPVLDLGWRWRLHCVCDGLTVAERKTTDVD